MAAAVETSMDETTLSTINLLESRLLRVEHLLCGQPTLPHLNQDSSALQRLRDLESRLATLLSEFRVYDELLKIYKTNPDLFQSPGASQPPTQLSIDGIEAMVLASASSFSAVLSYLTAIQDAPVPDPKDSAALIGLKERMKGIQATQLYHAAQMADLRKRSEAVVQAWYESGVLQNSQALADAEGRIERVEIGIRREEHRRATEDKL